jgi:hypothetical protein
MIINQPTFIATPQLYVAEVMQSHTFIRVINNDTGEEMPQAGYTVLPQVYQPNKVPLFYIRQDI